MAEIVLSAELREEFGKGAARRLRRASKVPAVLYGHGADPVHLAVDGHDAMLALKQRNALLSLEFDGRSELALPKAVQRDPLKGFIRHVDFVLVRRGEKVVVDVTVVVDGAVTGEGVLTIESATLAVRADATALPSGLHVDVTELQVGDSITAGDIELPPGVELAVEPDTTVVTIAAPQVEAEPETGEAVAGEVPEVGESDAGQQNEEQA